MFSTKRQNSIHLMTMAVGERQRISPTRSPGPSAIRVVNPPGDCPPGLLAAGERLVHGQRAAGAVDNRQVDELATEGDGAVAASLALLEGLDHPASVVDLALVRPEGVVHDL